jgi:hypothetical protein
MYNIKELYFYVENDMRLIKTKFVEKQKKIIFQITIQFNSEITNHMLNKFGINYLIQMLVNMNAIMKFIIECK